MSIRTRSALWLGSALAFVCTLAASFLMLPFFGQLPSELQAQGVSVPAHWEAAYNSHGQYVEGLIAAKHPIRFVLTSVALVAGVVLQIWFGFALRRGKDWSKPAHPDPDVQSLLRHEIDITEYAQRTRERNQ